jgi:hypothetical protein
MTCPYVRQFLYLLRSLGLKFFSDILVLSPVLRSFDAIKSTRGDDDTQVSRARSLARP